MRKLAALREAGHRVRQQWVAEALRDLGYRLQGNRTTREGSETPTGMPNSPTSMPLLRRRWPLGSR